MVEVGSLIVFHNLDHHSQAIQFIMEETNQNLLVYSYSIMEEDIIQVNLTDSFTEMVAETRPSS